jgi:ABC-2 type transport system permease protein
MSTTELTDGQRNRIAMTIVRREVARIMRIWGQTLVPPAITMTLYFLIFGNLIGSRVVTWAATPTCSSSCRAW